MRKFLMGLMIAGGAAMAMGAQAAPRAGSPGAPVPVLSPAPRVQPVQYYEDWRHREWRRREAYERWRRQEARRRWHQEQLHRHGPPHGPGPRYGYYGHGGPRW